MIINKEKEFNHMQTEVNMKDSGKIAKDKERELLFIQMEVNMKESGKMVLKMAKVLKLMQKGKKSREFGKMASGMIAISFESTIFDFSLFNNFFVFDFNYPNINQTKYLVYFLTNLNFT